MNSKKASKIIKDMMIYKKDYDEESFLDLLQYCDLNIQDFNGNNPLMFYINKTANKENINKIKSFITRDILFKENNQKDILLIHILMKNKDNHFNYTTEEIYNFLSNADINQINDRGCSLMEYTLLNNQQLDLTDKQLKDLWNKTNVVNQENIFFKLTLYNYEREIQFLLYDCNIHISENIQSILEQNEMKEILKKIEKRDILFHLDNSLDDNHKKVNKQKI